MVTTPGLPQRRLRKFEGTETIWDSTAEAQNLDTTYRGGTVDIRQNGSLVIYLTVVDKAASGTPVTLTVQVEFAATLLENVAAADWFIEGEEDSAGDVTKKVRTLTLANFSNGDDVVVADLKCGSYNSARVQALVDQGEADVDIYAGFGAQ